MKKNKIAESWEKIELNPQSDKRILNQLMQLNGDYKREVDCSQKRFTKKSFVPVLVGLALFFLIGSASVVVYAHLVSSGKLFFHKANEASDKNTDVTFVVDDATRVNTKNFKGNIKECESIIKNQVVANNMYSSQSPYGIDKSFDSIKDALDYIGYDKFVWTRFNEKTKSVNLFVDGTQEGKITDLTLISNYKMNGKIEAQTEARIFTENYNGEISVGATSYSDDFPGVDYSGKTVVTNGREFWVVDSTEFEDGWLGKMVYWQENNVIYTLDIRYQKEDEKQVAALATNWMEGF